MTTLTVTDFSRNMRQIFDRIEFQNEEIQLIRNNHKIARIIPGAPEMSALEVMADLYQTLSNSAGEDWELESRLPGKLSEEIKNPYFYHPLQSLN